MTQDELIHILVPQEKFNNDKWFYPKGKTEIEVMQLPFFRIRDIIGNMKDKDPLEIIELSKEMLSFKDFKPIVEVVKSGLKINEEHIKQGKRQTKHNKQRET